MKIKRGIILLIAAAAVAAAFTGCDGLLDLGGGETLTITQRVAAFQADVNDTNRTALAILENFGPAADMTEYDNAKDIAFWDAAFPSDVSYTFTITDQTDTDAVLVTGARVDANGNNLGDYSYSFRMYQELTGNWLIREIYEDPTGTNDMLIKKVKL